MHDEASQEYEEEDNQTGHEHRSVRHAQPWPPLAIAEYVQGALHSAPDERSPAKDSVTKHVLIHARWVVIPRDT